jgi:hypothetical protein
MISYSRSGSCTPRSTVFKLYNHPAAVIASARARTLVAATPRAMVFRPEMTRQCQSPAEPFLQTEQNKKGRFLEPRHSAL